MTTNLSDSDLGVCLDYAHLAGIPRDAALETLSNNGLQYILNFIFDHTINHSDDIGDGVFATLTKETTMLRVEPIKRVRVSANYYDETDDETVNESDEYEHYVENPDIYHTEEIRRRWRKK